MGTLIRNLENVFTMVLFSMLGWKTALSPMLDKHSTTELNPRTSDVVPTYIIYKQRFLAFLLLQPFNPVPHDVLTLYPHHRILSVATSEPSTVMTCTVNIFGGRGLSKLSWPTSWEALIYQLDSTTLPYRNSEHHSQRIQLLLSPFSGRWITKQYLPLDQLCQETSDLGNMVLGNCAKRLHHT